MNYLSEDSLKNLLARPDQATIYGRRDAALLCVLYDTGARVQELIDLSVRDVRIGWTKCYPSDRERKENEDRAYPAPDSREF
ncbi:tyrosine-type recombinase/integrase [Enterocloster sp.]|uniref:tyrosine-type recombinase/integrase n=1 Tax=Enterocloster sp. TaxID=2719315 RepID=UPI00399A1574